MRALFALPYAFGSAAAYRNFKGYLDEDIDFHPLDYPGHSSRFNDSFCTSIQGMAEDALEQIEEKIERYGEYGIMGYSMGSLVGFELCNNIIKKRLKPPKYFFAFASPAPDRIYNYKNYETYGVEEIRAELKEKDGTPEEILNNREMLELFLPIIKSDLIALRDYHADNIPGGLQCTTVIVRGADEKNKYCHDEWKRFCGDECEFHIMDGGHFFMFENDDTAEKCAELVNRSMR